MSLYLLNLLAFILLMGYKPMARITELIAILSLLLVLLFVTTVGAVISTEKSIQHYFGMPDYVGAVPEHVNAAITRQLPRGSSRDDVQRFLSRRGIGTDGASLCEATLNIDRITCHLAIHHHPWELLRKDYTVTFQFGVSGKLQNILVKSVFSIV
jgi:hypothetical protein